MFANKIKYFTTTATTAAATTSLSTSRYKFWNNVKFRRVFRVFRVSVLTISFGGACYALGQVEYISDPQGFQHRALNTLLSQNTVDYYYTTDTHSNKYNTVHINQIQINDSEKQGEKQLAKVSGIFQRVRKAMLLEIDDVIIELKKQGVDKEIDEWKVKRELLAQPWELYLTESQSDASPNALVNGFLPRKLFITGSLLREVAKTDEELALVLSHELSHFVLGHTRSLLVVDAVAKVFVLSVLSLFDFTGGLGFVSFVGEALSPSVSWLLGARFSRRQEIEADRLGLRVTARACFEPAKTLTLFSNMQDFSEKRKSKDKRWEWLSVSVLQSHPVTEDRFKNAVESLEAEQEYYKEQGCDSTKIYLVYKYIFDKVSGTKSKEN